MELIFEFLLELIIEPIIDCYISAMTNIFNKSVNRDKLKNIAIIEAIILFVLFIIGGIRLLQTNGNSVLAKIVFFASVVISALQIIIGIIIKIKNKR